MSSERLKIFPGCPLDKMCCMETKDIKLFSLFYTNEINQIFSVDFICSENNEYWLHITGLQDLEYSRK